MPKVVYHDGAGGEIHAILEAHDPEYEELLRERGTRFRKHKVEDDQLALSLVLTHDNGGLPNIQHHAARFRDGKLWVEPRNVLVGPVSPGGVASSAEVLALRKELAELKTLLLKAIPAAPGGGA